MRFVSLLLIAASTIVTALPTDDGDHTYITDLNTGKKDIKIHKNAPVLVPRQGGDGAVSYFKADLSNPTHRKYLEEEVSRLRSKRAALQKREEKKLKKAFCDYNMKWVESDKNDDYCNAFCDVDAVKLIGDKPYRVTNDIGCQAHSAVDGRCGIRVMQATTIGTSETKGKSHSVGWATTIGISQEVSLFEVAKTSIKIDQTVSGDKSWSESTTQSTTESTTAGYDLSVQANHTGHVLFFPYLEEHCGTMHRMHKMAILDGNWQGCAEDLNVVLKTEGRFPRGMVYSWAETPEDRRINWSEDYCFTAPLYDLNQSGDKIARGIYQVCDDKNTGNACNQCYLCSL